MPIILISPENLDWLSSIVSVEFNAPQPLSFRLRRIVGGWGKIISFDEGAYISVFLIVDNMFELYFLIF